LDFFLIVANFLKEQNLISFEKFVSFMLAFLCVSYGYIMFGFSAIIFYSLLLIRIILFLRIWYNVISNMIFWLCQFKIVIKPKTFIIFVPLNIFCILNETQSSFCMFAQSRAVSSEPEQPENYVNLSINELDAFIQERRETNINLKDDQQFLEVEVDLIKESRQKREVFDENYEREKVEELRDTKVKRLVALKDLICFEKVKSYKLND